MASATLNESDCSGNSVLPVESLPSIIYHGHPVISTECLAKAYGVKPKQIRDNFTQNRERFVEGKHFYKVEGQELRQLKDSTVLNGLVPANARHFTLYTARGSARHAKALNTDIAWDVYERMEDGYFSATEADLAQQAAPAPIPTTITPSQQQELQNIVAAKSSAFPKEALGRVRAQLWSRLHNKFKVAKYDQLPAAAFPEAVEYLVGLAVRGAFPEALPDAEPPLALPPARTRNTLDDYKALYRGLPDSPHVWIALIGRLSEATGRYEQELEAIRDEATKPFRANRKSQAHTYFDAALSPIYSLFDAARAEARSTYTLVYDALKGCREAWMLLNKG